MRNVLDGTDVGGDVFACKAIAAGRGADQLAVFIAQRQRQAVDLRFGDKRRNMVGIELEKAPDTINELRDILITERIAERQHGNRMLHFRKAARRRGANLLRGRIRSEEIRKFRSIATSRCARIVGRIRNGRRIFW